MTETFAHYLTFARALLDRVYWLGDGSRAPESTIESGTDALEVALRAGRGLLIVGAHLGSFEALRAIGLREGRYRVRPLMYLENSNKTQQWLAAVNPRLANDIIAAGRPQTMLEVREALARGEMVGVLADRSIVDDKAVAVRVLGEPARFPTGAYRLALLLDVPIFFGCSVLDRNRYRIFFEELDAPRPPDAFSGREAWIRHRIEAFAATLERYSTAYPLNWFNFYDFWQFDDRASD